MARYCRWLDKVFTMNAAAAALRDSRRRPQIPTASIFLSALMMSATRMGSLNALQGHLRAPQRWEKIIGPRLPSADSIGRVVGLIDTDALRDMASGVNHKLRRNKGLDNYPWPLRFAAFDGHEFFSL
jgi:hypothetical protein